MIVESVEKDELHDCEGLTIAEVAERTGKHPIDAMLDLAVEDELKTTFVTRPARALRRRDGGDQGGLQLRLRPPRRLRWRSAHEVHHPWRLHDRVPSRSWFGTKASWTSSRRTGGSRRTRPWRLGSRTAAGSARGAPADIVVYDYENLELKPQEKAFDFPAGRMAARKEGIPATAGRS